MSLMSKAAGVEPGSADMVTVLGGLIGAGHKFLPSTFSEIDGASGQMATRLRLATEDGWEILFPLGRVDIVLLTPDLSKSVSFPDFRQKASEILEVALRSHTRRAHRLAFQCQMIVEGLSADQRNASGRNMVVAPDDVSWWAPFEWNTRAVTRVPFASVNNELVNVGASVTRGTGEYRFGARSQVMDAVLMEYDVNTVPENDQDRFSRDDAFSFIDEAWKTVEPVATQLSKKI